MKRLFRYLALGLLLLVGVLAFGAWRLHPEPPAAMDWHVPGFDLDAASARLAEGIRIATVSTTSDEPEALAPFAALHALLERSYPRVHETLKRDVIGGAGLLYRWPGKDAGCAATLYAAHQDVVPVEPGTESEWKHPPFSGDVADDAIWGRGTLDDKGSLFAILEAVETLLGAGFAPPCDVYLAFGYDEEIGGTRGAARLSKTLLERGVRLAYAVDEGGAITTGAFPGLEPPLATVGVAEKGYLSLKLSVDMAGGHSSMPPPQTAIGILSNAIARLEAGRFPASLDETERGLLRAAGAELPFGQRLVFGNLWLTAPLVEHVLAAKPATDATLRTTVAATIVNGGVKENVLPAHAEAVVNFRIRTGETVESVRARVAALVDDARVKIERFGTDAMDPMTPAPVDDDAFRRIAAALRAASPGERLVVAPYVSNGGTDLRHYPALTPRLYRIIAAKLPVEELKRLHGSNERLERAEYARMIRFYLAMLSAPNG